LEKPGVLGAALNYYRHSLAPQNWLQNWNSSSLITVPTLMLWGEDDNFLSNRLTEGMEKLISAPFKLKLIPQCGHWIQQEVPQIVNRELLDFFQSDYRP
jgi:epoxide hydrolase 4